MSQSLNYEYDVFISYSHHDREWVKYILLPRLEEIGLCCCIDFRDFEVGAPSVSEMERAILSSTKTLVVLSPKYLESEWAKFENLLIQTLDPVNSKRRLIPVLLQNCKIPLRISYLTYVNLEPPNDEIAQWEKLYSSLTPKDRVKTKSLTSYNTDKWHNIFNYIYEWTLADQIPESGGWGLSQYSANADGQKSSESTLEIIEGGINSTFFALRGLKSYKKNDFLFRREKYAINAKNYLLARQIRSGGFGRFVKSRSGKDIFPSIRHTAYAVSSLIDLAAPPKAIINGLKFIEDHCSNTIADDVSPSEAIGIITYVINKISKNPELINVFKNADLEIIQNPQDYYSELFNELANLSFSSSYSPFWTPYGRFPEMKVPTSLATIDLIASHLPKHLETTVFNILLEISDNLKNGGIPCKRESLKPDLGLTAYYLVILTKLHSFGRLSGIYLTESLSNTTQNIATLIEDEFFNNDFWENNYPETLPNLLILS
jgi:hypothetical protein